MSRRTYATALKLQSCSFESGMRVMKFYSCTQGTGNVRMVFLDGSPKCSVITVILVSAPLGALLIVSSVDSFV